MRKGLNGTYKSGLCVWVLSDWYPYSSDPYPCALPLTHGPPFVVKFEPVCPQNHGCYAVLVAFICTLDVCEGQERP